MNIGTFKASENGFTGTIRTLTVSAKVTLVPVTDKASDNSPDYLVKVGNAEVGAGWKKTSRTERPYVSVSIDDPTFPEKVYASLVENKAGGHDLIWSRQKVD